MNSRCFYSCLVAWSLFLAAPSGAAVRLKIQGSTTLNPVVAEAAEVFRKKGWDVLVDTQGGSSGGISSLGEGLVDLAMASKPVSEKDRKQFPSVDFKEHAVGYDGVALVVSRAIYDGGVKALTREQIRSIYESKITNWKQVGGPDLRIVFFNKEPGRGTWEVFAQFLYGKAEKAPKVFHPEVGANEEARSKIGAHPSAIGQLSASWAGEDKTIAPLGIRVAPDKIIEPSLENIKQGTYPIRRALSLVSNGNPNPSARALIEYLRSDAGKKLFVGFGYLPVN